MPGGMLIAPSACVLVPNFNGLEHLQACLSSLVTAAGRAGAGCAIVLVDNQSTDESVAFTRRHFPAVEVVVSPKNDYLFSLNAVARSRGEDVVIVVNNDMRFDPEFIARLLPHFSDVAVFAVGAAIRTWDGTADTVGPRCARVARCWFYKWWSCERQEAALTLEASGGAAAYRRSMFVELGGFDPLYRPGYYEDLDLSYRAWRRGWNVVYEPGSRAYHRESATMVARFGTSGKARLLYRNHLLFSVKNIGGPAFLAGFLLLLPYRVLRPLTYGYWVPLAGLVRALPQFPRAFARRCRQPRRPMDLRRFEHVVPLQSAPLTQRQGSGA
jgi:GT2 family glycosyltransferase